MRRQMTFAQYRAMDVLMFTALLCVCEALIVLGATVWFPDQLYTLSLTAAVTAIVLVRWGGLAVVPALCGGLVFCFFSGAAPKQYLIYCLGNCLSLALLPFVRGKGWKRLHENVLFAMLHGMMTALLMQLGRFMIAALMGAAPAVCLGFITTDVLSTFFSVLLVLICRRLDGMLEEQRHYLIRIQEEEIRDEGE
ncbi:MAG: hypothetical protein E7321_10100 [Clostridiales bacterium]|nr:hypothetical protein [Clostridiales bacterium]